MGTKPADSAPVVVRRVATFGVGLTLALIFLRLCCGWHFYREGTKKLSWNPETRELNVAFSAEPFLRQAVGPVAQYIKEDLPNVYNWERYLAVPRQVRESTTEELEARAKWESEYAARIKEADKKKEPRPIEFPPHSPYYDWASRIDKAWQAALDKFAAIDGLSKEQIAEAAQKLYVRREQLANYLAGEADAIAEWEHELWRLKNMEEDQGAVDLPFLGARIEEKRAETTAASAGWIAQVRDIEHGYLTDLRGLLTEEQEANDVIAAKVDAALVDANEQKLHRMNIAVTCIIIAVGACLMLGLFTRLAATVGIGFLLMVMATQPPWVVGADTKVFYYQLVEIAALAVLFASQAGRLAGLDYFIRAIFSRRRGRTESQAA
jgi:uncharacterized membrane protein YphA (DoxX/SURF4 family)